MSRILVVDDDADIRILMGHIMRRAGHDVVVCEDGPQALQMVLEVSFDAIVLDVSMPVMSDLQVLEEVKANIHTRDVPVVLVSAHTDSSTVTEGYRLGASAYVTKPFSPGELLGVVDLSVCVAPA